ncbi:Aerobic respiration control protein ArcA [compost metagenome]|jgi:two-component system OmpR family response regulator|nr:Aerobic respiration control protein ArcA [Pseudomonas sp. ACN5]
MTTHCSLLGLVEAVAAGNTLNHPVQSNSLDTDRRRLIDPSGNETLLTHGEYQLLSVFLRNSGHTLSQIRNREWVPNDRSIDVLVGRLRRKLHDDPAEPQLIITIHGAGYLFTAGVAA